METLTAIINFIMHLIDWIRSLFERGNNPDAEGEDEKDKDKTKK